MEHYLKSHQHRICPICKTVSEMKELNMHLMRKHTDFKNVTCECGMNFDDKYVFKHHFQKYHEMIEECICDICGSV